MSLTLNSIQSVCLRGNSDSSGLLCLQCDATLCVQPGFARSLRVYGICVHSIELGFSIEIWTRECLVANSASVFSVTPASASCCLASRPRLSGFG